MKTSKIKQHKLKVVVLALASIGMATLPMGNAFANPTGGTVVAGNVTIQQESATKLGITQTSNKAIVDWNSFSIGANEHTQIYQPSASAVILNRVTGQDPSQILGRLTANGQVFLVNPNGIVFGKNAQIDVASLVASTHNIRNEDFLAGNYKFNIPGKPGASVINEGTIRVADTGIAAFIAPSVANRGVVVAKLGKVALAAANGFTLDFSGDQLLSFLVSDEVAQTAFDIEGKQLTSFVENSGRIESQGGYVLLTAKAAENAIHSVINQTGVIEATSVGQQNGEIILSGGAHGVVTATGTLDASGTATGQSGGKVEISGGFVATGGTISANGDAQGGQIKVAATDRLSLAETISARGGSQTGSRGGQISYQAGSLIETSTGISDVSAASGGQITMAVTGSAISSGNYLVRGTAGTGGRIDFTGSTVRLLSAQLDASGTTQGGLIRIGGEFQGGKTQDTTQDYYNSFVGRWGSLPTINHASKTFINDGVNIKVSSAQGQGGTAVIWSDSETTQLGAIDATGLAGGGAVEISSADNLRRASLLNVNTGAGGFLLLDPKNITIANDTTAYGWSLDAILGKSYSGGKNLDVSALETNDTFGSGVAFNSSGTRLAVGAGGDDGSGNSVSSSGSVYLFSFSDTSFSGATLQGTIGKGYTGGKNVNVTSLEADDLFGSSVALNAAGTRLAVGAYGDDGSGNSTSNSGAVHLFSFTDTSFTGGNLEATVGKGYTGGKNVDLSGLDASDQSGYSVALNAAGDRLAIGAPNAAGSGNSSANSGEVHLISFTDTSFTGGSLQATIGKGYTGGKNVNASSLDSGDIFGAGISLNATGDRLAVGARSDSGSGNSVSGSGAVYLYSFSDSSFTGGTLQATIGKGYTGGKNVDDSTLEANDFFGQSVALNANGNKLAVGIRQDDGSGNTTSNSGAIKVFSFSDTSFTGGTLESTIGKGYTGGNNVNVTNLEANDFFGTSVAFNAVGDRLVVGAGQDAGSGNPASISGAAYLFSTLATNTTTSVGFSDSPTSNASVTPSDIISVLNQGTNLTLLANNDITVTNAITADNPSGNGGNLTMAAGRSITLNASITTDNGNLTLIANETNANGVQEANRDTGAASITNNATINAGTGSLSYTIRGSSATGRSGGKDTPGTITQGNKTAGSTTASTGLTSVQQTTFNTYNGTSAANLFRGIVRGDLTAEQSDPVWNGMYQSGAATATQTEAVRLRTLYDAYQSGSIAKLLDGLNKKEIVNGDLVWSTMTNPNKDEAFRQFTETKKLPEPPKLPEKQKDPTTPEPEQKLPPNQAPIVLGDDLLKKTQENFNGAVADIQGKFLDAGVNQGVAFVAAQSMAGLLKTLDHAGLKQLFGDKFASAMRGGLKNFANGVANKLVKESIENLKKSPKEMIKDVLIDVAFETVLGPDNTDKSNLAEAEAAFIKDAFKDAISAGVEAMDAGRTPAQMELIFMTNLTISMAQSSGKAVIEAFNAGSEYSAAQKQNIVGSAETLLRYTGIVRRAEMQREVGDVAKSQDSLRIASDAINSNSANMGENFGLKDIQAVNTIVAEALIAKQNGNASGAVQKMNQARELAAQKDGFVGSLKNWLPGEYSYSGYLDGVSQALGLAQSQASSGAPLTGAGSTARNQ